ncbi:MAG: DNA repair ATPase [Reinekea sp.]|nr:DNA repair ATPase [Reinekea sp.]
MTQPNDPQANTVDNAVAEGGAYEVISKRLAEQGSKLYQRTKQLNDARLAEFGSSDMAVKGRTRVRTENNCIARDIVQVGEHLLFGYNVFIGLKKETKVDDVFALFDVQETDDGIELVPVSHNKHFLTDTRFVNDFTELYRYYKNTKLIQLVVKDGKLLAAFQIGERLSDQRVFRWSVSADGKTITYIDNRGERDIQPPPHYDFEWTEATRDNIVNGRHPHINVLDTVFVETIGGDLTVKIENNTEDGLGIYREPVDDDTQSLDDCKLSYAKVGHLILLSVLPYKETKTRYLIYNTLNEQVMRVDAIGESCVQLPEDHGLIFPGGYYLQNGEYKAFDEDVKGLKFQRMIRSPNGEDVLYVFYEPDSGVVGLFAYNLISKQLQNPIFGHGYALAEDGRLVIFSAESEATRVHPMQVWQTPYVSDEFASTQPQSQSFYGKIGNAALVRGVSDLFSICRSIDSQSVSSRLYEELSKAAKKVFDDHYWLDSAETKTLAELVREVAATSELVIDEFEKVQSIQAQSKQAMAEAEQKQTALLQSIRPDSWQTAEEYVNALSQIRQQRGHLITIRELRYIDQARIDKLEADLQKVNASLSEQTVAFLSRDEALNPYFDKITQLDQEIETAATIAELTPVIEAIEQTAAGLDLLTELMNTLKVADATVRTQIIDAVSSVYAQLNQSKANAKHKQKNLGSSEAVAQFGAQFKLFSQSIVNALGLSTTPEKCEEQLSRLLVQLEELESQFSDYDQFLTDIMDKREEVYESFESHKQQLLDERQRKAQSVTDAATRMLSSIEKRSLKFTEADQLNTYFATDALVLKIRDLVESLRELDAAVKADDIEARLKSIKEQALRSLRDKTDIYEAGGNVIKLGPRHKFSVNTQELDLTIIPRNGLLNIHLTGTNYFEAIEHPELLALKDYWEMSLESETPNIYRAEYLAALILHAAEQHTDGLSIGQLSQAVAEEDQLSALVRDFASPRYKDGYEKGIHDFDAAKILRAVLPALTLAELLRFDPMSRGIAALFWSYLQQQDDGQFKSWPERAQSALQMNAVFASQEASQLLAAEIGRELTSFIQQHPIDCDALTISRAADYLVAELAREPVEIIISQYGRQLSEELQRSMSGDSWRQFEQSIAKLQALPAEQWKLTRAWLQALVNSKQLTHLVRYIPEACAQILTAQNLTYRFLEVDVELAVDGLMGDHARIQNRELRFSLDDFLERTEHHRTVVVPTYHRYLDVRQRIISDERDKLRLHEFKARPLASFVRNRLINESYLPLIGDNLAKQMGTVGESKRTDLMGLLMMISPPGYGKTTLMEYVANRLGLIFMKINCPSLGHDVLSLDPQQAPNATARQELEKLNLALEMGNNVMLYLDDIQHTHPEFLQKFISLCDGTRRVEGVWQGKTKTYDMRGKKFCVVMAGNPYTESGEAFKIPDMLANRADIYNLGDILGGMDEQFALSYIENALTSNPVLAPLATREMDDTYKLIKMAQGHNIAATDLAHQYSGAEIQEITGIIAKMFVVQDVVLKINKQYIASAAQDDKYRTEPAFKLQGSYRNMNKMTEKISAVMNQQELMQMIADHYLGEAQLLTTGAEDNLLKLAELRGNMTDEQATRWTQIKKDFLRNKAMGGDDADVGGKVVAQLADLADGLSALASLAAQPNTEQQAAMAKLIAAVEASKPDPVTVPDNSALLAKSFEKIAKAIIASKPTVEVVNEPVQGLGKILEVLATTIEESIFPIMHTMDKKLDIDLRTHEKMKEITQQIRDLDSVVRQTTRTRG